ncbi:MAG: HPF/RaiA family ribosome-associated protein [Candidatus Binatia bacterium]|nr:HPF/RaiA family ribosome-associated protein [Candidatus Binatia bacterium]
MNEPQGAQAQVVPFTWNLVTREMHGHPLLRKQLTRRLQSLEKHLRDYPPDGVHLHILLEKNPHRTLYNTALTLRLPKHILHTEKSAREPILSLDKAFDALVREVERVKGHQRKEEEWKRKLRRQRLPLLRAGKFAPEPLPEGEGPQEPQAVVVDFLKRHYRRMVDHVRRHVRHDEFSGELPPHAVDPRGVVDTVVQKVLAKWRDKPASVGWLIWVYRLLHEELRRRRRFFQRAAAERVPVDQETKRPDEEDLAAGYDAEQPLDIIVREYEPVITELRELVPDPFAPNPEVSAERRELLEAVQHLVQTWSRPEKDVFELYFVEGFSIPEISMVTGMEPQRVKELVATLQERLRGALAGVL